MALDQVTEYSKFLIYQMKDLDSTHAKIFRESSAILKNEFVVYRIYSIFYQILQGRIFV